MTLENRIRGHIAFLYGEAKSEAIWNRLNEIILNFRNNHPGLDQQPRQGSRPKSSCANGLDSFFTNPTSTEVRNTNQL